jgi:hypothetical protein
MHGADRGMTFWWEQGTVPHTFIHMRGFKKEFPLAGNSLVTSPGHLGKEEQDSPKRRERITLGREFLSNRGPEKRG